MKFVLIIGSGAVGKMTVGQELARITDLRLFHNHMMIEPVIDIFGHRDGEAVNELRDVIFRRFAASGRYGLIFTYMWAFDLQEDWDYVAHVREIFAPFGTDFYCVELIAPMEIRLARNTTENRLRNKASKRDLEVSKERIRHEEKYRLVSEEGEIPFENYLRIDNSEMSAEEAARLIKETFQL
ncbi:MAG: shikimate kinase [Lachnospiraceae bacterium]|nr:shikimate kinase [Lachnospiraceae bacterium]